MNLLPLPPQPHIDLGRASELVSAVNPARKPRDPAGEREQAARSQAHEAMDAAQREALMAQYQQTLRSERRADLMQSRGQRATEAYKQVASQDQREGLADMLGVSEYA